MNKELSDRRLAPNKMINKEINRLVCRQGGYFFIIRTIARISTRVIIVAYSIISPSFDKSQEGFRYTLSEWKG